MAFKIQDTTVIDDNRNGNFANLSPVRKPINQSPANATVNVNTVATLTTLPYRSLYSSTHTFSRWQVSNNITFTDVYYDSGNASPTITFDMPFALDRVKTYFWRASFSDQSNSISPFSDSTQFTTSNVVISTPTLQVAGAPNAVRETPTLTTSSFAVTGNASVVVTHFSTDWQILRASNAQIVYESLNNQDNKTTITVPASILQPSTQYCFRARHNGNVFGPSVYASNVANTQSAFVPETLGESFGGGFYTGTINIGGGVCYYLIVAPNSSGCASCQWKTTRTFSGGNCECDGFLNTYTDLTSPGQDTLHPAANWTATRTIGSFSDWYLPAINELNVLYTNKNCMPAGENYSYAWYWSSTQCGPSGQFFARAILMGVGPGEGFVQCGYKNASNPTRAVRRIPI